MSLPAEPTNLDLARVMSGVFNVSLPAERLEAMFADDLGLRERAMVSYRALARGEEVVVLPDHGSED